MDNDATPPKSVLTAWQLGTGLPTNSVSALNPAKIVRAGIDLADEEGLSGLSIRQLGEKLGTSAMALYRHIDSREDLIALMSDVAFGAPPETIRDTDTWQGAVACWAEEIEARYRAHPWLLDAPLDGFPASPNRALWLEYILQSLRPTGLNLQDMLDASLLVDGHARNTAYLNRELQRSHHQAPTGPWLKELLAPATFPMLSRVIAAGAIDDNTAQEISFGLARIIAGIESLTEKHEASGN